MKTKLNIKAILLIIFSSVLLGVIYNTFSADGIPFIREELKVKTIDFNDSNETSDDLSGLDLANTINLYNQGNSLFIDARDQWEFGEGHIKGAINIPEFSFTPEEEKLKSIDKDQILIIYCSGDECETSKRLAAELQKMGFKNSFIYLGGFSEWLNSGLPIERDEAIE